LVALTVTVVPLLPPAVVVVALLPLLPEALAEPLALPPPFVAPEVAVLLVEFVPGAVVVLARVTALNPIPHPVSPAAKRAALTTMRDVLMQRCRRNGTMLERVMCILGLWSELDL
jgi:hypothetical protein